MLHSRRSEEDEWVNDFEKIFVEQIYLDLVRNDFCFLLTNSYVLVVAMNKHSMAWSGAMS